MYSIGGVSKKYVEHWKETYLMENFKVVRVAINQFKTDLLGGFCVGNAEHLGSITPAIWFATV
jgi:hypothetical protein